MENRNGGDDGLAARQAQRTWALTLEQIPTRFGRLVYLASLRNANSGAYKHHGLAQAFGAEQAERTIRLSHEAAFAEWLSADLGVQHQDLLSYLAGVGGDSAAVLETWGVLAPYKTLPPAAAGDAERMLYETDLEVILELLRSGAGGSPGA